MSFHPYRVRRQFSPVQLLAFPPGRIFQSNPFRPPKISYLLTVRHQKIWRRSRRKLAGRGPHLGLILDGEFAVLQAAVFDGLPSDAGTLGKDLLVPAEVGVSRRHVAKALVVPLNARRKPCSGPEIRAVPRPRHLHTHIIPSGRK